MTYTDALTGEEVDTSDWPENKVKVLLRTGRLVEKEAEKKK